MPTIQFLENRLGPALEIDAAGPLIDACDEAHAPVSFSCRSASCGTCRVAVTAGTHLLEPPGPDERAVLELFASPPDQRLACQMVIRSADGRVQLRWIDDGPE